MQDVFLAVFLAAFYSVIFWMLESERAEIERNKSVGSRGFIINRKTWKKGEGFHA